MKTDMAGQVRAYAEHLETKINDWQIDDVFSGPTPTLSHTPVRVQIWRGPLIGLTAMTLVLAFGGIVWLLREAPSEVVAPTPSTVASTPEATVPPATSTTDEDRPEEVSGLSFEWTRVRLPGIPFDPADPFDGMERLTVAVFDGGLVVAGGNQVWMSPDGVNWAKTITFPAYFQLRDIIAGGPGLVAVTASEWAGTVTGPPRIWTSTDGITWTQADLDGSYRSDDGPAGSTLRAVAGRGADLVAVGHNFIATSNDDGVTWAGTSLERHPELGINVWMHDVTVGGPGFVAVGGSEDGWSAAWTSRDGTTWSRQSFGQTSGSWTQIEMKSVTTGGPGFVAVGHGTPPGIDAPDLADDRGAWVWTSPDGFTWTRAPHNAEAFENSTMNDVTAYGDTLVAVGGIEGTGEEGAVVWTSADGITWQRLPHDDLFDWSDMSSVVAYGDRLIAAGGDSVWIATQESSGESTP